jgi:hypothetical protein
VTMFNFFVSNAHFIRQLKHGLLLRAYAKVL